MEKIIIELDGKDYEVKEPTIHNWAMLNLLKDLEQDEDFVKTIVSISTGIEEDLLDQANFLQVKKASDYLTHYFLKLGEKFYPKFEFKEKEYKFLDMNNLSFGHFIDIDTFLSRDESYRKSNMNELMGMLYMEKDEDKYDGKKASERKELFRELPVKYLQGSLVFFLSLKKVLRENTPYYLKIKWKVKRTLNRLRPLGRIGDGIQRLFIWLVKTLKTLKK